MLKETWTQFLDGHALLTKVTPESSWSSTEYFREGFFEKTEEAYAIAHDFMIEVLEELEPPVSLNSSADLSQRGAPSSRFSLAHLPPIPLPQFDGKARDGEQFRDRFNTLIVNNAELSDFARMHFLSSCLSGTALECIKNLPITADNFAIAWRALIARFENKRRLLSQHFSTFFNLPALTRESASDLQTLHDQVSITVASLNSLHRSPSELWDDVLVYIIVQKLDPATRKAWNVKISDSDDIPSFDHLNTFIANRSRALEEFASGPSHSATSKPVQVRKVHVATAAASTKPACDICKARHFFSACPTFTRGNPSQRRDLVRQHRRCFNCLSKNHAVHDCMSKHLCRICNQKHHSLLHDHTDSNASMPCISSPASSSAPTAETHTEFKSLHASATSRAPCQVLLSTAWVTVSEPSGRTAVVRAMLDSGSQVTFITETLAQSLRTKRLRIPVSVSALGCVEAMPSGKPLCATHVIVSPTNSRSSSFSVKALILPRLTDYAPKRIAELTKYPHLANLSLADPTPTSAEPVQIIIGADLYNEVIIEGRRKGKPHEPTAQNSIFGWVISGPIHSDQRQDGTSARDSGAELSALSLSVHHSVVSESLEDALRKFWEVEELPAKAVVSTEDEQCEKHFIATHSRAPDGRYIVCLPFRSGPPIEIGDSRTRAERQLGSLYRRLLAHPDQAAEYSEFLSEYERLGHMRRISTVARSGDQIVFIPHHPVLREDSVTSHLRVVFNASSRTSNGTSLNDHLCSGFKLQTDLPTVILQWRQYQYVYVADIAKMYRQVLIDERDVNYQCILWKPSPKDSPVDYQLQTVTYGMACAPFLALRVIKQLVADEGFLFPLAVPILRDHIYVDDVLFGHDNLDMLLQAREQLIALLRRGGFELRKWASNSPRLLQDIDVADHGLACTKILATDEKLKILGIGWAPSLDVFQAAVSLADRIPVTKREILSAVAKQYDPLGWLTPTTIAAKVIMQQLWREGLTWDDPVPASLLARWTRLYSSLSSLRGIKIKRWIGWSSEAQHVELHGFADASNLAYAAVVYARVVQKSGSVSISLLAGKSRVAPLKPLSVPRLELSGAVLLARLLDFVKKSLSVDVISCVCWTDSTVVLSWLRQHPSRWKTFVANRVAEVQSRLPDVQWRYVPILANPADCASRGLLGNELLNHALWWQGPPWLSHSSETWPENYEWSSPDDLLEENQAVVCAHVAHQGAGFDLASRCSSWSKLIRITAYVLRFVRRCRHRGSSSGSSIMAGPALTVSEYQSATLLWIKRIQMELFSSEIHALKLHRIVSSKSVILALRPFLDPDGLLRVGGRIRRAPLPFPTRHPILLASHPLVLLIIEQAHLRTLHAGLQLTLSTLRREFWIIRARSVVRAVIRRCVACARERAEIPSQLMGDLPAVRVTALTRAFIHCGIDYAGPVQVRASSGRGIASRKAYIALFICLATRAVHVELVADYSSSSFRGAFTRFCSCRGLPQAVYSDNGTTFVGADRELARAYRAALRDPEFMNATASDNISWHFIPPAAQHFGGLWEAGVRCVKHHVRRVLGSHTLTFEEFTTLLCGVEACLNSRPIAPLTDSLDDCEPLTPGHFLIGTALNAIPEPSLLQLTENQLTRWQLVRQLTERFWRSWYSDYVNTLQQRSKWRQAQAPIKLGQLVLLRNPTLPPCKWELGRVTACHPGDDGLTRVVTVKTATSEHKRPIVKLCALPIESDKLQQ